MMDIIVMACAVLAAVSFKDAAKLRSWDAWNDHKKVEGDVRWPGGRERPSVTRQKILKMDPGLKPSGWLETRHAKDIRSDMWSIGCETLDRDYADWDQYKGFLAELGATQARFFSGWAKTEQEKGKYDFAWLDRQLRECKAMGIKPWVCISYGNPVWGSDFRLGMRVKQVTGERESFDAWLRYVKTLVARYKDIVDEWEVWNEPFNQDFEYAEMFYETAKAIREVQPKAKVLCTAVSFPKGYVAVLEKLKKENALDLADRFVCHPYAPRPENSYAEGEGQYTAQPAIKIRRLVKSYSPQYDILQGEAGCPSQLEFDHALKNREWTEYAQAKWNLRRAIGDRVRGIPSSCFTFIDLQYTFMLQSFGLVRSNTLKQPIYRRPSFFAMQNVYSYFDEGVHAVGVETRMVGGRELTVARFERQGVPVAVVWFSGEQPGDSLAYERVDLTNVIAAKSGTVWCDLMTGRICDLRDFTSVPVWDSPVMIASSAQVPRRAVRQEMSPAGIGETVRSPDIDSKGASTFEAVPLDATKGAVLYGGFTAKLTVDLDGARGDEPLYEAGAAKLSIRMAGRDKALERYDLAHGNYLNFPMPDGTCPVLEATIVEPAGRVGVPLGALANAGGVHEVTLDFSPVKWSILVDGLADETVPVPAHPVEWPDNAVQRKLSGRVKSISFLTPSRHDEVFAEPDAKPIGRSIQYWTPDGFNTWVGDVAPAFLDGKLHVFYLLDRRHHSGGCGTGRHQFAHLATDDLVHWVEHPLAVPITEPWQTVGTGTPFLKDGKLAIAFGWHTSRYPEMKGMPLGGTYAVSDDGIRFRNSGRIISDAQNPSIYNREDGSYELVTSYGGSIGIFRSADLVDWKLYDDKLPFRGDCPSLFDWHGHRYLLQGFVNMAYSPDGRPGSFVNWSAEPDKLYEGLSVPMVVPWKGDRRLYIGWLRHLSGWGGWLVFREVVSYPDGRLGLKWVPEIEPPVPPQSHSVRSGENFTLKFRNRDGGADLLFTIDAKAHTASFVDDVPNVKLQEARSGADFRIGGLRGVDGDYGVRLIRHYDAKSNATIFDAEIAGQRTMVCRRKGRFE